MSNWKPVEPRKIAEMIRSERRSTMKYPMQTFAQPQPKKPQPK